MPWRHRPLEINVALILGAVKYLQPLVRIHLGDLPKTTTSKDATAKGALGVSVSTTDEGLTNPTTSHTR